MNEVLKLFEGLTEKQARELRRAIMPTLWELRKVILDAESKQDTAETKSHHEQGQNKQRLHNGTMQSKNKQRASL
jgi:hypothetical protein